MGRISAENLFSIGLSLHPDDLPVMEELVGSLGIVTSGYVDVDAGTATLSVFSDTVEEARLVQDRIKGYLPEWQLLALHPLGEVQVSSLRREDWAESWKKHFHAFRASRRILVKPSWENVDQGVDDVVVELDPGMCFGTGYHGTTRACLMFMDDLAAELGPVSFLDVGCGSGILSLAAARLGFQPLVAFDHDPDAVATSRENLARAGVDTVELSCADLAEFATGEQFRIVVANVLAHVLQEHAEVIVPWVRRADGHLVLSGILTEQYPDVKAAYERLGLHETGLITIEGWTSGCFVRD